jgi:DinB superfamily
MAQSRSVQLLRRVRALHKQWTQLTTDLSLDQVNYRERAGVLPIAFSLHHYVVATDRAVAKRVFDDAPVWEKGRWDAKVGATVPSVTRGTPIEVAEHLQFGDYDAWLAYQGAVFSQSERGIAGLSDDDWDGVVWERLPDQLTGGYLALVFGTDPVRLGELLDALVLQHGMRHLGEIEHARALLGLHGVG